MSGLEEALAYERGNPYPGTIVREHSLNTKSSEEFLSNRTWLRDAVGGKELILRGVSALEYLELFVGYCGENTIEVYALQKGEYENVDYRVVDSFVAIEIEQFGNVLCSSVNQAVNDMLSESETTDELVLTEALAKYYYAHSESFEDLKIKPENVESFEKYSEWSKEYFNN